MTRLRETTPERAVQELWARSAELAEAIVTLDGQRMSVVYPGRRNTGAGPDFLDAVFVTDSGETVRGDVEIHVHGKDWYAHGHHTDPNYNGVILHVVLKPNVERILQSSGTSSPSAVIDQASTTWQQAVRPSQSPSITVETLDAAGEQRFLSKSRGYSHEMASTQSPDQVAYEAIMEALGYSSNRRPFLQLARRVPFKMLYALNEEPASTRRMALKALLAGAAGLIRYVKPERASAELIKLRRSLPAVRPLPGSCWSLFRVRPANHPVNRVLGAAVLMDTLLEYGPMHGLRLAVRKRRPTHLVGRFVVSGIIGRARALDIVVNAILPTVHAWAGFHKDLTLMGHCIEMLRELPPPSENAITREMRALLGIPRDRSVVASALRHQGLMHLYRRHVGRISDTGLVYSAGFPAQGAGLLAAA